MMPLLRRTSFSLVVLAFLLMLPGCQALRQVANLRTVDFRFDGITDAQLAGIELGNIQTYEGLGVQEIARLGSAFAEGELPMQFDLHVTAENPAENDVEARMTRMDWTLFLEDQETVSGIVDQNFLISPGEARDVPIRIELDLVDFFDGNARDLLNLALSVTGVGGDSVRVKLEATPTVETPVGPIRYPNPVTITNSEVGS